MSTMLQLVYISTAVGAPDMADILKVSRRNNAAVGVTGLLYHDGKRFLQALEGPEHRVQATYDRIARDPRHRALVMLSRRPIELREFGAWDMALRSPGDDGAAFVERIRPALRLASPSVRATFEGLMTVSRAA